MLEGIVLGLVQGITEWLPVSSKGVLLLTKLSFFPDGSNIEELLQFALFIHLGTLAAAIIYFRRDIWQLIRSALRYRHASDVDKRTIRFLIGTTVLTGVIGFPLLKGLAQIEDSLDLTGKMITIIIAGFLLLTGYLQLRAKIKGERKADTLGPVDTAVLGVGQGLTAIPGLSRSGTTVSIFLLRGFEKTEALRLSFLMSLPVIFFGNIVLNLFGDFTISAAAIVGAIVAGVSGLITIHLLFLVARKVNFGWFVMAFGLVTLLFAVFV